jgi:hypothetical protein
MKEPAVDPVAPPAPPVHPAPRRRGRSAAVLNVALGLALVLATGGVAFAAGRMTAPATGPANGRLPGGGQGFNGPGSSGAPGGFQGGGPGGAGADGATIEGTVESITATTLTIKTASGQTIQIALSDTTTYHAQSNATSDDVASGGKVLVRVSGRVVGPAASAGTGATLPTANDVTVVP